MRTLIVQFFKIPIQLSTRLISADATSCTWSHRLPPCRAIFLFHLCKAVRAQKNQKGARTVAIC
jgi:hypothetical protein